MKDKKEFDGQQEENLSLYNDFAYKIIPADKSGNMGLYEEKTLKDIYTKQISCK